MTSHFQNMTQECGHQSACDNGEHGDLANGLQLMSSSTHLFL